MKAKNNITYRTRAIISRGLYIFRCGLYCRAVSVTDNLCTKTENSSIFGSKMTLTEMFMINIT